MIRQVLNSLLGVTARIDVFEVKNGADIDCCTHAG
jgi:hypothetical protein